MFLLKYIDIHALNGLWLRRLALTINFINQSINQLFLAYLFKCYQDLILMHYYISHLYISITYM